MLKTLYRFLGKYDQDLMQKMKQVHDTYKAHLGDQLPVILRMNADFNTPNSIYSIILIKGFSYV